MVARVQHGQHDSAVDALAKLAEAGTAVAASSSLREALTTVARTIVAAARAEAAVVYVLDSDREDYVAVGVAGVSSALTAKLEGTRFASSELRREEVDDVESLPPSVARLARWSPDNGVLQVPVVAGDELVGSILLLGVDAETGGVERAVARVAAAQAGLAIEAFGASGADAGVDGEGMLALAGDALAAGADGELTAKHVVRLAVSATAAAASLLWRRREDGTLELVASMGSEDAAGQGLAEAAAAADDALAAAVPVSVARGSFPADAAISATLQLGNPAIGALQLLYRPDKEPSAEDLSRLTTFGVRAAQALRASGRARTVAAELERTRALLEVVGQAFSQLSLAHTLETAVARVAELFAVERLAVYLCDEDRLYAAAGTGLTGPHVRLAERLLELALGPFRGRGMLAIGDVAADSRLAVAGDAAAEAGIESAIAVPLLAREETIGLLAFFPERSRTFTENESTLLRALAAQLAVAVQNAQLHEQTKLLGEERERALDSERTAARRLRGLYEISRSFAQSLSLEATLEAVARTVTDVLAVDLAAIFMPDERREVLVPRALHVADERIRDVARTVLWRPQAFGSREMQRVFRLAEPFELTPAAAKRLGTPAVALAPLLERGWTGAVVPVATPAEVLGSLVLISTQPGNRVTRATIDDAQAIGAQAALAIDNARLYQQQKEFADTMQRSLLPRTLPDLPGLDLGEAYQSSARVEVGGDIYDFVQLDEGRLAVVLGDVTGHGIEAAADMAMAKFVFRSLAREHSSPGDFLQAANEIVVGEIAPGKFITMIYLVVDRANGVVAGAGAGHPPPRLISADGSVRGLEVRGLVLGIEAAQTYEEVRAPFRPGDTVVLYTDGVLEARRAGELYGFERLDAIVSAGRDLSAQDLAETVLADCRDFANNELADDCAVVVIKCVD